MVYVPLCCSFVLITAINMACTRSKEEESPSFDHSGTTYTLHDKSSNNIQMDSRSSPTKGNSMSCHLYSCKDSSSKYVRNPSSSAYVPSNTCGTRSNNPSHCNQLVLYQPSNVLPIYQEKREFEIARRKWMIVQQWNEIGLAAVIWEAAIALSEYIESLDPCIFEGKRVIELGAGTGLVGMVASCLGASSVVLTDKNTVPAKNNLKLNLHNLQDRDTTVLELDWGVSDLTQFGPPYDIILAADVVYIEDLFLPLIQTLRDLSSDGTMILLSCKRRYVRDDKFFELLKSSGEFSYQVVKVWGPSSDVKVYRLHKRH